jgi:hypothetical protein
MKCPFIVNTVVTESAKPKAHRVQLTTDSEPVPVISIHWETSKLIQQVMNNCIGADCASWRDGKCRMVFDDYEAEIYGEEEEEL